MKVAINKCYGGFSISDAAYEFLIKHGVPVRKYIKEVRGEDGLYKPEPKNEGRVIFDRELTPEGEDELNDIYYKYRGRTRMSQRYWDCWTRDARTHPLIIEAIERLGKKANGPCAELAVVNIPDGVDFEISEYDGLEHIAEKHRTWA